MSKRWRYSVAVPMSRMISEASGKEGGKQCLKPAALPENRKRIKEHACNRDVFRERAALTFLSERLVSLCLDSAEQLSSLHAVRHTQLNQRE